MADRKVRFMLESGASFSVHGEGITIQAVTRKSEVPVTIEIEGVTRRQLLQLQAAIEQDLARREAGWKQEWQRVLKLHRDDHPEQPDVPADEPSVVEPSGGDDHRPAA
jgi:hypothetical protein